MFWATSMWAQSPRQVILVNGNVYMDGNQATVARYDITTSTYQVFDSIPARFVSDIIISGSSAFVAADTLIVRYDIDTYQATAQVRLPGVRKLVLYGNQLWASTGYGGDSLRLRAFDASTLQPLLQISGTSGDCEGIVVHGDSLYAAVPGAWGSTSGKVAVVDLLQPALVAEIDLDSMGRGIDRMYLAGGKLWTVNSIAYANPWGVVSEINLDDFNIVHHRVELNTLHSPGIYQNSLYLRRGTDGVFQFDPTTGQVSDSLVVSGNFAAGVIDSLSGEWYLTQTDFFSFGRLIRFSAAGVGIDTVEVGISPEALAIDYRTPTGEHDAQANPVWKAWPNPVSNHLHLHFGEHIRSGLVEIFDLQGNKLMQQQLINNQSVVLSVDSLPKGVFCVRVSGPKSPFNFKIVK